MSAAVLKEVDGSPKVMIEEVLGAGLAIHTRKDTGIGRAVEHPVGSWKIGQILFVADVPHPDIDAQGAQGLQVGLAPLTDEAVDAGDLNARAMLKKAPGDDGSREAADSGDEKVHMVVE